MIVSLTLPVPWDESSVIRDLPQPAGMPAPLRTPHSREHNATETHSPLEATTDWESCREFAAIAHRVCYGLARCRSIHACKDATAGPGSSRRRLPRRPYP